MSGGLGDAFSCDGAALTAAHALIRRRQYLTALLRQEMAYFDTHDTGALLSRVVTDTNAIQLALSSKCPNLIHHGMAGVIGVIIGLIRGWQMALVVCATLPLMGAPRMAANPGLCPRMLLC